MVLRRCRFIVVVDASADPTCGFADLGNAIRRIRVDLGVPIEFPADDFHIRARGGDGSAPAGAYWAMGRIRYSAADMPPGEPADRAPDYDGRILYVKPSYYGTEPRDVCNYAESSPTFPHESTTDQFFSESQFESYRALGEFIVERACGELRLADELPARR
jgi:hypothetical protein